MDVTITNAGGRIEIVDLRNDLTNNYDVLKDGLRLFNLGDIVRITFINRRNIEINYNEVELINGATSILPVSGVDFLNELNILLGDFGAGGGATELNDLTDVLITTVANGEVLIYDSALSKWVNTSASGGGDMFKSVYDTDNDGNVDKAETVQIIVRNSTGSTLTKGQIVYLSGATGNRPNAVLAQANNVNSKKSIGWVTANIANNSDGFVAVSGSAHDLDTSAFTAGDLLYLSSTVAGGLTNIIPAHPNYEIFIGFCARAHPNFGRIIYKIQEVLEIESLHDVSISSVANNQVLTYESSTSLWKNKQITERFELIIAASDETTALTIGTNKVIFRMPRAVTLTSVRASLTTAQASGTIFTVDINENGTSILSTKITIDNTEKTSTTAATLPVISDSILADDSEISVDIDQIGNGTAKGLKVYLIGTY
jgi:hypothetical protein